MLFFEAWFGKPVSEKSELRAVWGNLNKVRFADGTVPFSFIREGPVQPFLRRGRPVVGLRMNFQEIPISPLTQQAETTSCKYVELWTVAVSRILWKVIDEFVRAGFMIYCSRVRYICGKTFLKPV